MTVLELLDELEEAVETASGVPLTGRVILEKSEITDIIKDIRNSLPDDVKQAKWLQDERDKILEDAKTEYQKLVSEAKKQAEYLVDENDITLKARKRAEDINKAADLYAKDMKMRTYDYLDRIIYNAQGKIEDVQNRYMQDLYNQLADTFAGVEKELEQNRSELRQLAIHTKNGEEWMYTASDSDEPESGGGKD